MAFRLKLVPDNTKIDFFRWAGLTFGGSVALLVAALVLTLFFGARFLLHFMWLNDPGHADPDLEGWMRPRFVAMSYDIPRDVLAEALEIGPPGTDRRREPMTMADIAAAQGVDLDTLTARVAAAATQFHGALSE